MSSDPRDAWVRRWLVTSRLLLFCSRPSFRALSHRHLGFFDARSRRSSGGNKETTRCLYVLCASTVYIKELIIISIIILPGHAAGHKVPQRRQSALSLARCSAWCQEFHPFSPLSLLVVFRQVSLGCPLQCFPSGVQVRSVSIQRICPIHVHRLFLISLSICGICVVFSRSLGPSKWQDL